MLDGEIIYNDYWNRIQEKDKEIERLNNILNELEKYITETKLKEFELEWEEFGFHDYKFLGTGNHLLFQGFATSVLNDEVEIVKDKKINKDIKWYFIDFQEQEKTKIAEINMNFKILREKLTEIIECLEKENK